MASTILDVAKLSGYSKTTVSRTFLNPENVPETTRTKVFEAAKKLNYTPNAIARAMVRKRTDNIAFILSKHQYPAVLNPFYSPILETVLQTVVKENYSLFISPDTDLSLPNGEIYLKNQMDGVLIAGKTNPKVINGFMNQNLPVVLINNKLDIDGLFCITADHYAGARLAMNHLVERGHRKIGLLAGNFSPQVFFERYNAYIDVQRENNLQVDYRFVQSLDPNVSEAFQYASSMLVSKDRPSAFFCTNDTIAIGTMKAAIRLGLRIPDDIAVIGIDDSTMSSLIEPELTTIHIDTQAMGLWAAETIIALINHQPITRENFEVDSYLVVRNST